MDTIINYKDMLEEEIQAGHNRFQSWIAGLS
jgi:hypothetical protein